MGKLAQPSRMDIFPDNFGLVSVRRRIPPELSARDRLALVPRHLHGHPDAGSSATDRGLRLPIFRFSGANTMLRVNTDIGGAVYPRHTERAQYPVIAQAEYGGGVMHAYQLTPTVLESLTVDDPGQADPEVLLEIAERAGRLAAMALLSTNQVTMHGAVLLDEPRVAVASH